MALFIQSLHKPIHPTWQSFLSEENKSALNEIETVVQQFDYTPGAERVLHFLTLDLSKIKIIILGQDPYPQAGVATGRAFEVGTLTDWNQPFRNVSLKNIVRLIHATYEKEYRPYKEIIKLHNQKQTILPPNKLFKNWEKQGVLLLNTAFTCEIGKSATHSKLWKAFSLNLHRFIVAQYPEIYWILWGNHAQKITSDLPLKNTIQSNHPMMCSKKSEKDFLFGQINTFEATKHLVDWRGTSAALSDHATNTYRQGQLPL